MRVLIHLLILPAGFALAQWTQPTPDPLGECEEDDADVEDTRLLQTDFHAVQEAAEVPLPTLRPWGHSYYSSDPEATARYLTRYFNRSRLIYYASHAYPCGGKKAVVQYCPKPEEPCLVQILVNDPNMINNTKWTLDPDYVVNVSNAEFLRVANESMRGLPNFSAWMDNHDGWRSEDLNADLLLVDGTGYQEWRRKPPHFIRLSLPGTMWTMELHYSSGAPLTSTPMPDLCRNLTLDYTYIREDLLSNEGNGWWKSTFAVPHPTAAADFVIQALGAERLVSPFPSSRTPSCVFAEWVVLRKREQSSPPGLKIPSGFMLHFVRQSEVWPPGEFTVEQFAVQQERNRDLEAGVFDIFMYNSLILRADTLDPYVLRLQAMGVPFLPVTVDGEFAVFVDVPKNGIVLQLRSTVLTVVAARSVKACL